MKTHKIPTRTCVGCRSAKPKNELIRVVRDTEGLVSIDYTGKKNGRGAYICNDENCLKRSIKSNALARALDVQVSEDIINQLKDNHESK